MYQTILNTQNEFVLIFTERRCLDYGVGFIEPVLDHNHISFIIVLNLVTNKFVYHVKVCIGCLSTEIPPCRTVHRIEVLNVKVYVF